MFLAFPGLHFSNIAIPPDCIIEVAENNVVILMEMIAEAQVVKKNISLKCRRICLFNERRSPQCCSLTYWRTRTCEQGEQGQIC